MPRHDRPYLTMAVCVLLASRAALCSETPIEYTLTFPDAQRHYVDITMKMATGEAAPEQLELMMAVWTPGSYLVREFARHIESLQASDSAQRPLRARQTSKNRWTVDVGQETHVTVTYRVYCHEMSVRTNWVEHDFAMLNGAPTFLTIADSPARPHDVRLVLPKHWQHSVTSLKAFGDQPHRYRAANFDELVDSPIVAGNPAIYPFQVGEVQHLLVNQGGDGLWDGAQAVRDVEKIVAQHHRLWGVVPYDRYVFLNMITETGGGLEHDFSTLMMTSRWRYRIRKGYLGWLGLVSHEFFHTWNIRRLRPKALVRYDYENENYTRLLWVAEGVTSYYDDLLLLRSGLCSQKEYLELLSKNIQSLESNSGRQVQTLGDSSFNTWIKFYRPDENSSNSRISYYTKGAVVAFLLDAKIRQMTADRRSLDEVMRLLYQRHQGDVGYSSQDFRAIASEVAGADLSEWFGATIDSTAELPYQDALDWYGLGFEDKPAAVDEKNNESPGEDSSSTNDPSDKPKAWIGLTTTQDAGRLIISRIKRQSPAAQAGLNTGDEILALDGFRVLASTWGDRLKQYQPQDEIRILVSRREKLLDLPLTLAQQPAPEWKLIIAKEPSEEQQQRLGRWLSPLPPANGR